MPVFNAFPCLNQNSFGIVYFKFTTDFSDELESNLVLMLCHYGIKVTQIHVHFPDRQERHQRVRE